LGKNCASNYGFLKYAQKARHNIWGKPGSKHLSSNHRRQRIKLVLEKAHKGGSKFGFEYVATQEDGNERAFEICEGL
jgi:hypothetical protein